MGDGFRIVLYTRDKPQWATRMWWMLHSLGFDNAAVLDGGFEKWVDEGRPLSTAAPDLAPAALTPRPRAGAFVGKQAVLDALASGSASVLNALSPELHRGDSARYGRPGRIAGSSNVPAADLVNAATNTFVDPETAAKAFQAAGVTAERPTVVYCGGGIAATLDAFLLHQLGHESLSVYDASMSEWARDESLPMETG